MKLWFQNEPNRLLLIIGYDVTLCFVLIIETSIRTIWQILEHAIREDYPTNLRKTIRRAPPYTKV